MLTYFLMIIILLSMALLLVARDSKGKQTAFFDLESTNCMRGFWCLVILLVHVPEAFQNPIQDLIGSFAYIGVTFFFMTSGYGLMLGVLNKGEKSTEGFWLRRLPKLLIPMFLTNIISSVADWVENGVFKLSNLVHFHGFVTQLILFYFLFWIVFRFFSKKVSLLKKEVAVCTLVLVISLVIFFFDLSGWATESFGFIYGILLACFKDKFEGFAKKKWILKCLAFCAASLVFGIIYIKFKHVPFVGDYLIKAILGCVIIAFILTLNVKFKIGNPISRFSGKISYEVYLLHNAVFVLFGAIFPQLNSGAYILLSIIVSFTLAIIIKYASEKLLSLYKSVLVLKLKR